MRGTMTWLLRASLALALLNPALAAAQTARPAPTAPSGGPTLVPVAQVCDATSIDSPPGKAWWAAERWRYADDATATKAYQTLVNNGLGGSPWPTWFVPTQPSASGTLMAAPTAILPVGTRFQMALAPGQKETWPGGWGTFDYISTVEDVRKYLAVTLVFKSQVDRVVTYEVTRILPVAIGPIGPQIDTQACQYLPGRWSQFNMLVPGSDRMDYLKVIEVRPIQ
ncbi:hypothetical protein OF829_14560 [Sphingomonas sp. LB-2]|uniref:hypothetical protein n=1 Tax=Sphingomonas caeni TaxID=2984949 RepID=UPI00222FFDE0|nr:hypothetical protein [Sphingomonas caeni]MCW3848460.1 hypothetical protein [Sphingomonas caeni]